MTFIITTYCTRLKKRFGTKSEKGFSLVIMNFFIFLGVQGNERKLYSGDCWSCRWCCLFLGCSLFVLEKLEIWNSNGWYNWKLWKKLDINIKQKLNGLNLSLLSYYVETLSLYQVFENIQLFVLQNLVSITRLLCFADFN